MHCIPKQAAQVRVLSRVTPQHKSAYEVKNGCYFFERLFKVKKNGVFLFGISFLYYANEEIDDVIGGSTKTVQHSIKNNSRNIGAVFFKLGTRNAHHKRNRMTPTILLPWQHSWLQSLFVKNKYPHLQSFIKWDRRFSLYTWFPSCLNSPQ